MKAAARPASTGPVAAALLTAGAVWLAFLAAHAWLIYLNLTAPGVPLGDLQLYAYWVQQGDSTGSYVGLGSAWVYPILALLPMMQAAVLGFHNYNVAWLLLVTTLDALGFLYLVGWHGDRRSIRVGWWWIAFLVLLGPIALGRIDSVTVPIAVIAVLIVASHPRLAAALLAIATWVKVWPAVLLAALVVAVRDRLGVLVAAIVTSAVVVAGAVLLGAGPYVYSFIGQQTSRNLQVEAPVSTVWLWMAASHVPGVAAYYDPKLSTWQVSGPGEDFVASVMNTALAIAVLALAVIGYRAMRRGAATSEILPALALAFTTSLIAFNKVGSPQYVTWLSVPVILGLAVRSTGHGPSFRIPAIITLAIAGLTQVIYPYLYGELLGLNPLMLAVITIRNVLLFVLLGWAVVELWRTSRLGVRHEKAGSGTWLPESWPFQLRSPNPRPASKAGVATKTKG